MTDTLKKKQEKLQELHAQKTLPIKKIDTNEPIVTDEHTSNYKPSKYQEQLNTVQSKIHDYETLIKDMSKNDKYAHECGCTDEYVIDKGYCRNFTIETQTKLTKYDIILVSIVSNDGSTVLGGVAHYLEDYKDNDKSFNVIVENYAETRLCRVNYHLIHFKE